MPNEQFVARFNDELASKVHEYREPSDIEKSEAVRRLVARGLEAREDPDALLETVSLSLAIASYVCFAGAVALWGWFEWTALPGLEPVIALFVLTGFYLAGAWGANRWAFRRGRSA